MGLGPWAWWLLLGAGLGLSCGATLALEQQFELVGRRRGARALARERGTAGGGPHRAATARLAGPSIGLVATVGWDIAQSTRLMGQVRGQVVTLGGGLAWGWRPGRVGVGGHVSAAGGGPAFGGCRASRACPRGSPGSWRSGPRIRYGRLRFDIDGQLGAMLRPPIGLIDDEAPMTMGGLWAGLVLRLGGALR